jgi:hypothetical protein
VPARKRKVNYPPPRNATAPPPRPGAGPESGPPRPGLVAIDLTAAKGRSDLSVGDRVRIVGTGLYAGEVAIIEKLSGGVIPSAYVRTEAGRTRQARKIDLEPINRDT